MDTQNNDIALRKRSQIAKANRTMLIWIAIASALVGVAAVVGYFMTVKLFYNERVLGEKQTTLTTLESNNKVIASLEDEIRALDTNTALAANKANDSDQAIQVILDALPSDVNSLAFGSSLQNKLLTGIDGLTIETLRVDPVVGVETLSGDDTTVDATTDTSAENAITFTFGVTGSQENFAQVLKNLERSIRPIVVTNVRIEILTSGPTMSVQGKTFYEPAKSMNSKKRR